MDSAQLSAEERLRQIQERIAEKTRAKAKQADGEALDRQIAEAEQLEKLVDEHGILGRDFRVLYTQDGHMVAVKAASYLVWKRFQSQGIEKVNAQEDLVNACLIYPSKVKFSELRDRYPALVFQAAIEIANMASVKQEELTGK